LCLLSPARGQDTTNNQQPVTRQEFEELRKDNADLRQEVADLKKQQADQASNTEKELGDVKKQQADQATSADQDTDDFDKQLKTLNDRVDKAHPGLESLVIAGDANFGFSAQRKSDSTFFADMSPLILWQPVDSKFLIETAFDLGIGGADVTSENTTVTLNLADISYEVCDNFVVGGGLFAVPFGQYHNHFDPPWIDKFPDDPLAFDAIAPISEVGFFAKGVIPSGTTRWTYDIYAANGPNLITNDPNAAGQLNFNDYTDLNNNKAVGGRIGFLPFDDMDLGYSLQFSQPNPDGFQRVYNFAQAADFHWKPLVKPLGGKFDLAAEWIWSDLSAATYDPTGSLGFGPSKFSNDQQGGYVSLGYRATEADNKILQNLEYLVRYDSLRTPLDVPGGEHESRLTLGVDYWVTSYIVVKTAYEIDNKKVGPDQNAFILQIGVGL
jgi:NTP pyrophosphatase (non-canonical NTP hydrolase)